MNKEKGEEMEGLELISFDIIRQVGTAKSKVMESMQKSRKGEFEEAKQLIQEANKHLLEGEKTHFQVITKEAKEGTKAKGKNIELTILFIHAEDQLMSAVTLRDLAQELLESYRMMFDLKQMITEIRS
ncbi:MULTISPECIES: PTS lactose/cellobiose transporter subunit IIA [unclassified Enterococcus]|uniref:PTS lactose/cellobiose transporter subunit IIA n=1 Tax=unclassified Enterococcus TaxID=2608891 RepID=UPI001F151808|nr:MULTISPECIES: PTS lactose/cellobiose transporter subunit IIA [unclassified Enterococcus]